MTERQYSREELREKVLRFRKNSEKPFRDGKGKRAAKGRELFLETDAGKLRLLAYNLDRPEKLPLFVDIHGGGFVMGCPEMDDPYMADIAGKVSIKILSVDYSLAPEAAFPRALDECYALVKYARNRPEEFGIDPERIALGGHSAGGNLSAAVCLKNAQTRELDIKCVILDYPVLDLYTNPYLKPAGKGLVARFSLSPRMSGILSACYSGDREERKDPLVSPVYASREQLKTFPPALIVTAGRDSLCAEGELFRDMLASAGVEVTHRRFENASHGFTLGRSPLADLAWEMMTGYLAHRLA